MEKPNQNENIKQYASNNQKKCFKKIEKELKKAEMFLVFMIKWI